MMLDMRLRIVCGWLCTFAAVFLMALSTTVFAQQDNLPEVVRVEGLAEIQDTLRRIENTLEQILSSQWEYRFVQRNVLSDIAQQIQQLGLEGWELVNVTAEEGYIFKRQIVLP